MESSSRALGHTHFLRSLHSRDVRAEGGLRQDAGAGGARPISRALCWRECVAQGGQRAQVVGSQFDGFRSVGSAACGSPFFASQIALWITFGRCTDRGSATAWGPREMGKRDVFVDAMWSRGGDWLVMTTVSWPVVADYCLFFLLCVYPGKRNARDWMMEGKGGGLRAWCHS